MLTEKVRNIVLVASILILTGCDFSYFVFKDLRRYKVLIGKCEWTHKTKYKQQIYKKKKQEINANKPSVKYGQVTDFTRNGFIKSHLW